MKIKYIIPTLLLILAAGFAGWYYGFKKRVSTPVIEQNATVVLEKIQKAFKFVAAEGEISDIYDYKEYQYYDISIFRKKLLVRVNAKVLVGYNFENAKLTIDEKQGIVRLDSLGPAEILAIDHDLDYYDIQEGTFNTFSEKELTEISAKAKDYASSMVEDSDLYSLAEEQKQDLFDLIETILKGSGWKLHVSDNVLKN